MGWRSQVYTVIRTSTCFFLFQVSCFKPVLSFSGSIPSISITMFRGLNAKYMDGRPVTRRGSHQSYKVPRFHDMRRTMINFSGESSFLFISDQFESF